MRSASVNIFVRVALVFLCPLMWAVSASAQTLVAATYGSGDNRVDVTNRIQSYVRDGSLSVPVNNQNMGADPAPHRPKDLRIEARDRDGQIHDYLFREGEVASLQFDAAPPTYGSAYRDDDDRQRAWDRSRDPDDLVILRAFYGINNATAEVTGHLQDLVRNNSLAVRVNNETLGIDPAHEHGKVLCVIYRYHGERRAALVRETEELKIP